MKPRFNLPVLSVVLLFSCATTNTMHEDGKFYPVDRVLLIDSVIAVARDHNLVIHSSEELEYGEHRIQVYQRMDRHYHSREQGANMINIIIKPDPEKGGMRVRIVEPSVHAMASSTPRMQFAPRISRDLDALFADLIAEYNRLKEEESSR